MGSWDDIRDQARVCDGCGLHQGHNLVFGNGRCHSDLMIIGEAPGSTEDEKGVPFVGQAGALLDEMLCGIGFRRRDVYVTNVVKHRPPGNRRPRAGEIGACRGYLEAEIRLVDPKVIMPLGNTAMRWFLGSRKKITDVRGEPSPWGSRIVVPAFHPAYVLRFRSKRPMLEDDFRTIRRRLDDPDANDDLTSPDDDCGST